MTAAVARAAIEDDIAECVDRVREAYLAHEERRTVNPNSQFLRFPDRERARIIALPAHLGSPWNVSGIKWISSFPDNTKGGAARASAALILNDHESGYPFACLEGSVISAARTAASAVVSASALRQNRTIDTLGVVGGGLIARTVVRFLHETGWTIRQVRVFDRSHEAALEFQAATSRCSAYENVVIDARMEATLSNSDVIVFATVASEPHVHDVELFAHAPLVLHISLRDISPEIILQSNNVVDDVDHVLSAGTSVHLAEQACGHRSFITGSIASAIKGTCNVASSRPTIVSPFGLGVLDVAVGYWVYAVAQERDATIAIPSFHEPYGGCQRSRSPDCNE